MLGFCAARFTVNTWWSELRSLHGQDADHCVRGMFVFLHT